MATKTITTTKDFTFILVPGKVNAHIVNNETTYCGLNTKIARYTFTQPANTELVNICQDCLGKAGN